jgi:hypothetical protein
MDDFGNPVVEQIASGKGPCRLSLQPFTPGEDKRLLFSHSPFSLQNAYNQPGPVFIHSKEVEPYGDIHRFPTAIKNDREHFHLTLIGYNGFQEMVFSRLVGDQDIDRMIEEVFAQRGEISFLHARSASACCYICRIDRY